MTAEEAPTSAAVADHLNRIGKLLAFGLIRDLERPEQIRLLAGAGYAPAEIASMLHVRPNTVSVSLHRARRSSSKKSTAKKATSRRSSNKGTRRS